jgi:hypothetical protein
LALRAVAVAAAVVGDAAVAAVLAPLDVTAECGSTAGLDGRHDLELAEADVPGMGRSPGRPVSAEDVGDLERGTPRVQGSQPLAVVPSVAGSPIRAVILSSGLVTVRTILVATRV